MPLISSSASCAAGSASHGTDRNPPGDPCQPARQLLLQFGYAFGFH